MKKFIVYLVIGIFFFVLALRNSENSSGVLVGGVVGSTFMSISAALFLLAAFQYMKSGVNK